MKDIRVKKVKGTIPDFHDGGGPSETVTIGLDIDGFFVSFGKYYFGPHTENHHAEIYKRLETFIDECVRRFES